MPIAPRPPIRWYPSRTDLDDGAPIRSAGDPAKVRTLLPPGFGVDQRDGQC